jgi:transglutaminase-like putative cysteine protease
VTPEDAAGCLSLDSAEVAALPLIDPGAVDWRRVTRTAYLVHQAFHYDYPGHIADLEHRLLLIPPAVHGDQRLVAHRLEVGCASPHAVSSDSDGFGNTVVEVRAPRVQSAVRFEAWSVVERSAAAVPHRVSAAALADPRYLRPSALTLPDAALRDAARAHRDLRLHGLDLALELNRAVHAVMRYEKGVTGVSTSAAEAFAMRAGVCQDFAHVMLALCRMCGLPARYVSGHLLGEGGTHAWVEVLIPVDESSAAEAHALDPTHGGPVGSRHITVAVGRDYGDVAPTSGSYRASCAGALTARRRVALMDVEYAV